jgi:hypothetical protein
VTRTILPFFVGKVAHPDTGECCLAHDIPADRGNECVENLLPPLVVTGSWYADLVIDEFCMTPSALLLFSSGPLGDMICRGLPVISAGVSE